MRSNIPFGPEKVSNREGRVYQVRPFAAQVREGLCTSVKRLFVIIALTLILTTSTLADYPAGDLNRNYWIDMGDLSIFASQWLDGPGCAGSYDCADMIGNNGVNTADLAEMAENWLVAQRPAVVISEFLASNCLTSTETGTFDQFGNSPDWIEIHNDTSLHVNLKDWFLTDDDNKPAKWKFPEVIIDPDDYLLVFASGKDITDTPPFHTNFQLTTDGEDLLLVMPDGHTAASEYAPEYPQQIGNVSYGLESGNERYFETPTPGVANSGTTYIGLTDPPEFSVPRGLYESSFSLELSCPMPGTTIRYTLDGTEPTGSSSVYSSPISVSATKWVRAAAFRSGWRRSRVETHSYFFGLDTAKKSLPIVSIVGDEQESLYTPNGVTAFPMMHGIESERPISLEWIYPEDNSGFQVNCGIRVQGSTYHRQRYTIGNGPNWTSKYDKYSFNFFFRSRYDDDNRLKYHMFPLSDVDSYRSVVLRAGHNDDNNPFIKDELTRRIHKKMGNKEDEIIGTLANLFINGEYKHYYNPCERMDDEYLDEFHDSDNGWDIVTATAYQDNGWKVMPELRNGDFVAWDAMIDYAQNTDLTIDEYYEEFGREHLDIGAFVDYLILELYSANWDWPTNNWSASRERSENGRFQFNTWDTEAGYIAGNVNTVGFDIWPGWSANAGLEGEECPIAWIYRALRYNCGFKQLFCDRTYKHFNNNGALTKANLQTMFSELENNMAGVRTIETSIRNTWIPQRESVLLASFASRDLYTFQGPEFNINSSPQHTSYVTPGDQLTMTDVNGGTIYYTLDGTEPRLLDCTLPPSTTTKTIILENASKTVLIPTESNPSNDDWRIDVNYNDNGWIDGNGGVGYEDDPGNAYDPYIDIDVIAMRYVNATCYIRIPFTIEAGDIGDIDSMTLKMRYDDGFMAYINGDKVKEVNPTTDNPPQWDSNSNGSNEAGATFNTYDISLKIDTLQAGDNLLAIHGLNRTTDSTDFLICTELEIEVVTGSGGGSPGEPSATAIEYTGAITLNKTTHVKARELDSGEWSALNEAVYATGPVKDNLRITEIMYHPADPNTEFIELKNIGTAPADNINLNVVTFNNGIDFTFGDVPLAYGEYVVLVQDPVAFAAKYPGVSIAGIYGGRLDNDGDGIRLLDAIGTTIQDFKYKDSWYEITDGIGFSLTVEDEASTDPNDWDIKAGWHPSSTSGGTPGTDDPGTFYPIGSITINELLAHSDDLIYGDWIELHNTTASPIYIGGWFLSDDSDDLTKYEIATGDPRSTIPAGGYVAFDSVNDFQNPLDSGSNVQFAYSENGETAYLTSGLNHEITGIYTVEEQFDASEVNVAFGRHQKSTGTFNFVAMSTNTKGSANAYPKVGPIVINEIMYHPVPGTLDKEEYEYIELYNTTNSRVPLFEHDVDVGQDIPWKFTDGIEYTFPLDTEIPAHGYLLVVKNTTAFAERHGSPAGVEVLGPYDKKLNNDGEKLELSMPGDTDEAGRHYIRIDRVVYNDAGDWPSTPDGGGMSLTRINKTDYGNDPINWQAATPTPGL